MVVISVGPILPSFCVVLVCIYNLLYFLSFWCDGCLGRSSFTVNMCSFLLFDPLGLVKITVRSYVLSYYHSQLIFLRYNELCKITGNHETVPSLPIFLGEATR